MELSVYHALLLTFIVAALAAIATYDLLRGGDPQEIWVKDLLDVTPADMEYLRMRIPNMLEYRYLQNEWHRATMPRLDHEKPWPRGVTVHAVLVDFYNYPEAILNSNKGA